MILSHSVHSTAQIVPLFNVRRTQAYICCEQYKKLEIIK